MADLRPISLCNVIYKYISKALENLLRMVLSSVIADTHSAFIPGRLITDNTMVGFECVHALRCKVNRKKKGFMSLKLDMSKAYDRVEWCFVEDDSFLFTQATLEECVNLKRILDYYSHASSQSINFKKSTVCFSKQISASTRCSLAGALDMTVVDYHRKYLGLPCVTSKSNPPIHPGVHNELVQTSYFFYLGSAPYVHEATVDMLKLVHRFWNGAFVRQSFSENEAEAILDLPLNGFELEDSIFWHFDKSGNYSVKSGYWIAKTPCF
ncbi:hypothetical protein Dsin_002263 [Dipteronia sinensis]|uniref:Reverse transcriptase domain-containing protein n=1 Tax=Dipteronia sinensis TaxID=43782 RepID=A0AAE0B6U2_9ROSI|nr:hypothetical protein Dsin_002263 [Dipteronia sinensis]